MRQIVFSAFAIMMAAAVCADAQSTQTSCFIQGARMESQVYDAEAKTATVVLSLLPDPTTRTSWGCFDHKDGRLRVIGQGFPPPSATIPAQAEIMAKRAARDVALGNLAECVCGVTVTPAK